MQITNVDPDSSVKEREGVAAPVRKVAGHHLVRMRRSHSKEISQAKKDTSAEHRKNPIARAFASERKTANLSEFPAGELDASMCPKD